MEQYVIDSLSPEYYFLTSVEERTGYTHNEEAKSKMSAAVLRRGFVGAKHPSYNTGKTVYLYSLVNDTLTLHSTYPNLSRLYEALGLSRTNIWRNMKRDSAFSSNSIAFPGTYKAYFNPINDTKNEESPPGIRDLNLHVVIL
jgi:hypothetical protein